MEELAALKTSPMRDVYSFRDEELRETTFSGGQNGVGNEICFFDANQINDIDSSTAREDISVLSCLH